MMEILLLIIGAVIGIFAYAVIPNVYRRLRSKPSTTNYDTRIDQISESGSVRYKLHKAQINPSLRTNMRGSELYKIAAPILGWEE